MQLLSVTVPPSIEMPPPLCQTTKHVSESEHPIGAMEEASWKVQKARTHAGSVGVDPAGLECDNRWCALIACRDVDAASFLPNRKELTFGQFQEGASIGAMGWFHV